MEPRNQISEPQATVAPRPGEGKSKERKYKIFVVILAVLVIAGFGFGGFELWQNSQMNATIERLEKEAAASEEIYEPDGEFDIDQSQGKDITLSSWMRELITGASTDLSNFSISEDDDVLIIYKPSYLLAALRIGGGHRVNIEGSQPVIGQLRSNIDTALKEEGFVEADDISPIGDYAKGYENTEKGLLCSRHERNAIAENYTHRIELECTDLSGSFPEENSWSADFINQMAQAYKDATGEYPENTLLSNASLDIFRVRLQGETYELLNTTFANPYGDFFYRKNGEDNWLYAGCRYDNLIKSRDDAEKIFICEAHNLTIRGI